MNLKKLIGFSLDTNQFTSKIIESEYEAKIYINKIIKLYGIDILNYMYLTTDNRFTTYKNDGILLKNFLNC